jgi:hypothetical protein
LGDLASFCLFPEHANVPRMTESIIKYFTALNIFCNFLTSITKV